MRGVHRDRVCHGNLLEQIAVERPTPGSRKRFILTGIQLAVAGRCGGFRRAGGAAFATLSRAAAPAALTAPKLWDDLRDEGHARHHQPDWFLQAETHRRASWVPFLRPPT